jgi:carboxypeptidase PM20D1
MPYIIIGFFVLFFSILFIRTLLSKPNMHHEEKKSWTIDEMRAYQSLSEMIQFPTISYQDIEKRDEKVFEAFRLYLQKRYPFIHRHATLSMHGQGMLFHIKGEFEHEPIVLMSHYDVVPVEEGWKDDPFSGEISDTSIYGRGALDTKHSLNAILEALEWMLQKKKTFHHDLYLAFGGDEETYGSSQIAIVEALKEKKIKPYLVLDEGGAIVSNIFPGVEKKAAVVGIAEKGFLNIELKVKSRGGHASTPPKDSPLSILATSIQRLHHHPSFRLKLTPPVKALFERVSPHSTSFFIRLLFANLWLFLPFIKLMAKMTGGELLSLFKTTQAFTMMHGSDAINVLPSEASVGINYRLIPGETSTMIINRIKRIIKDDRVEIVMQEVSEPSTISKVDERYQMIEKSIQQTWPDVIVSPYLMIATSDSRRYHAICDHVYKFSPMDVSSEDLAKIHGFDEDISKENVTNGIQFYLNLLDQC